MITLWRGFHFQWRYNHRANRIGSFVEREKARATAASGVEGETLVARLSAPDADTRTIETSKKWRGWGRPANTKDDE